MEPSRNDLVWGPLVRIGHWALALAFLVAFLTAGRPLGLHTRVGYLILVYVAGRVLWGMFGPARARFWAQAWSLRACADDVRATLAGKPQRHEGLGPIGSLTAVLMFAALLGTTLTGVADLAARFGEGPLSPVLGALYVPPEPEPQRKDIAPTDRTTGGTTIISRTERLPSFNITSEREDNRSGAALNAIHDAFAKATLWLIVLHAAWVIMVSVFRSENLILSMITGRRHGVQPVQRFGVPPVTPARSPADPAAPPGTAAAPGTMAMTVATPGSAESDGLSYADGAVVPAGVGAAEGGSGAGEDGAADEPAARRKSNRRDPLVRERNRERRERKGGQRGSA